MASIELSRIVKTYGDHPVLHGVDLSIADGEFIVLVARPAVASPRCCA